jgi:hypothetical protein
MDFGVIIALLEDAFLLGVAGGVDGDVESKPRGSGREDSSKLRPRSEMSEGWMVS